MSVTVTLRSNRIPALLAQIQDKSKAAVETTAVNIRDMASQIAPRDTGSLAESLYVSSPAGSDYSQRAAVAVSRNPQATILSEVQPQFVLSLFGPTGPNAYIAVVGAAAGHGYFQEFGTRYMGAQPFLYPAVLGSQNQFVSDMKDIAK